MKPIEYRARIEVDESAGMEVEQYAREKLRMRILNDQKFQVEVLKDLGKVKEYVDSQIGRLEMELKQLRRTPSLTMWLVGKNVHREINEVVVRINDHKNLSGYIQYFIEGYKHQLNKDVSQN